MEMKNTWTTETTTRRAALTSFAAAVPALAALPALAEPPPPAYALVKDYPKDARKMLDNMVIATGLARGSENMEYIVKSTRSEMNDFVAFYRRQPKVAGMPSFSTLYTAINTLSGHYASYGNKYPVPEKRRVRLQQQYKGKQQQHCSRSSSTLQQQHLSRLKKIRMLTLFLSLSLSLSACAIRRDRACARPWQVSSNSRCIGWID